VGGTSANIGRDCRDTFLSLVKDMQQKLGFVSFLGLSSTATDWNISRKPSPLPTTLPKLVANACPVLQQTIDTKRHKRIAAAMLPAVCSVTCFQGGNASAEGYHVENRSNLLILLKGYRGYALLQGVTGGAAITASTPQMPNPYTRADTTLQF